VCSGQKLEARVEQGRALTRWSSPNDEDILVLASPDHRKRVVHEAGAAIEIYDTRMPAAFLDREAKQIAGVLALYTRRLGQTILPGGTVRHVYSPKRKGQGMAGIARPGIIATSEGPNAQQLLDVLADQPIERRFSRPSGSIDPGTDLHATNQTGARGTGSNRIRASAVCATGMVSMRRHRVGGGPRTIRGSPRCPAWPWAPRPVKGAAARFSTRPGWIGA
jgi:hypothetical protein